MLKLVKPSIEHKETYLESLEEFKGENRVDEYDIREGESFEDFIKRLKGYEKGEGVPQGWVSSSVYWLLDDEKMVGRSSLRHELNEHLNQIGGHIGYEIVPSQRKKGYGTKSLELTLGKAKERGIERVLITCDATNVGSRKIIEKNGGVLENIFDQGNNLPRKLRYWITI